MRDTTEIAAEAQTNGRPAGEFIRVPLPLAQQMLNILAQLPYSQVADVVNDLRALDVETTDG